MTAVSFRRLFIDHGTLCVETAPGVTHYLPNPTTQGKRYDPRALLQAVKAAGVVNLENWRKMT